MLKTTTVGSYPRKNKPKDTLRKPSVSNEEAFDITINKYFRNKWKMKN